MRIAVVSDVHSNIVALEAVIAAVGAVDAMWHLGDVVGYGPEPDAVVARLARSGAIGVRGNHDSAAIGALATDWFNDDARRAVEWTRDRIAPATRDWLAAQPGARDEAGFSLVHGSYRDPTWEYITTTSIARANLAVLATRGGRRGLFGHTHLPTAFRDDAGRVAQLDPSDGYVLELDERPVLLNPGSVGQPRDGIPDAGCLVLDTEADTATWRRVPYDIEAVQGAMREAGLPSRLAQRLSFGL